MRFFPLLLLLVFIFSGYAQKHDNVWTFGFDSGPNRNWGGSNLYFTKSPPDTQYVYRDVWIRFNVAAICDEAGNLLFYTNGCRVFGADDRIIENGDGLNPGPLSSQCDLGMPGTQNSMFLPQPGKKDTYFLFHKRGIIANNPIAAVDIPLYYSKIVWDPINGKGRVIEKNKIVIQDTLITGELTGVKHANGKDWWVVIQQYAFENYYTVLFDSSGIREVFTQRIGLPQVRHYGGSSNAVFSPNGRYYAQFDEKRQLMVMDFDRQTGMLSNFRQIYIAPEDSLTFGGLAFSPNSRFLYLCQGWHVFQFDMEATDIEASKTVVATWDGYIDFFPTGFNKPALGPDCRIYIMPGGQSKFLHSINYPDTKGPGCQVVQRSVQLPTYNANSMHFPPHYRLGPVGEEGYPCDSTLVSTVRPVVSVQPGIEVFPNPAQVEVTVLLQGSFRYPESVRIYDPLGRLQKSINTEGPAYRIQIDLTGIPAGVYFIVVTDKTGQRETKNFQVIK